MSAPSPEPPISLTELDARHDDLLAQLDELDQRIQAVLNEHRPKKQAMPTLLPGTTGCEPMIAGPIDSPAAVN